MEKIYKLIRIYEDACLVLNKDNIDYYIIDGYVTDGIKLETIAEAIRGKSSIFDCEGNRSYAVCFQFYTEKFAKELDIFKFPDKYIILKDNPQGFKYLFRYISDEPRISISADSPFAQDTYEKAEHFGSSFTELWLDYIGKRKFEKYVNG